jgi:membrane protease subunit (stomatin/prohibitin family)
MGETIDSILNLPAKYDELSEGLSKRLQEDFRHFGLGLTHLYMNAITPPPEVQKAIDDRSRMGVFDDMNKLMQMKSAMAMEKASEADGDGSMGMGTSLGLMMPAMFAQYFNPSGKGSQSGGPPSPAKEMTICQDCQCDIPVTAKFCPMCGHQHLVFIECANCGKNLAPNAKFCSRCGHPAEEKPKPVFCEKCGAENLAGSKFCTQCGEQY